MSCFLINLYQIKISKVITRVIICYYNMLFGVAFWMVGRSVKPYRRLVSGLNVGYSVCLGFAMIYATNTIRGKTRCVLMSSICRNWFSFSNVTRPAGNQWLDGRGVPDH